MLALQGADLPMLPTPARLTPGPAVARGGRFNLTPNARAEAAQRRRLQRDLVAAARNNEFELEYQPIVALGTGAPIGAEAVVRWPHHKRGMVALHMFQPLAEQSGVTVDIGGWALRTACAAASGWDGSCRVSVNVSLRQIETGALLDQVAEALEQSGLSPERLDIELAEPVVMGMGLDMLLVLSAIRDLGVGLILDDFGEGLASLAVLRRVPLTALKLDRSMVRSVPQCGEDAAIVCALVQAAHALKLSVAADGVETELQRAFLASIGCDEGQGHLFGSHPPGM